MKKMNQLKTIWSAFLLLSIILFTTSCSEDDKIIDVPAPEDITDELTLDNQMMIGEQIFDFQSSFGTDFSGAAYFILSPDENVTTFGEIGDNVVMIGIAPTALGTKLDLVADSQLASISITMGDINIFHIVGMESLEGTLEVTIDEESNYLLVLDAKQIEDGQEIKVTAKGLYTPAPEVKNWYSAGERVEAIRTAFYTFVGDMTYLYVTSGDMDDSSMLDNAFNYYAIVVDNSLFGKDIDLATETGTVMVMYVSNIGEETNGLFAMNGDGVTTGKLKVVRGAEEGEYSIEMNITHGDYEYKCEYDDQMIDFDYRVPKANEYTFNGERFDIKSVVITVGTDSYEIYASPSAEMTTVESIAASPNVVKMTLPITSATGDVVGISNNVTFTYNGVDYNYENGSLGNILLKEEGSDILLEFNIFSPDKLFGYYKGQITFI